MTPPQSIRELSPAALRALLNAGITSLEEAAAKPDAELLLLKGFGQSSLQRLRAWAAGEPQPPTKKYGPREDGERSRAERIWEMYLQIAGPNEPDAYKLAVMLVDDFDRQAGGGA